MATIPASENEFPEVLFSEGAAPAAPGTGLVKAYAKSDGLLYSKDDAGAETALGAGVHVADTTDAHDASAISFDPTGLTTVTGTEVQTAIEELDGAIVAGGIPATIIDAAGDLIVGTAADTAARLAIGATDGMVLRRVGGALAWAFPPGHELDYVQITSTVNISGTSEGAATTVITGTSQAYTAEPIIVEFFSADIRLPSAASNNSMVILLYDGASLLGRLGVLISPSASVSDGRVALLRYRLTPTAATHQYIVKAHVSNTTNTPNIGAGAGGSGTALPAYIRVTKV